MSSASASSDSPNTLTRSRSAVRLCVTADVTACARNVPRVLFSCRMRGMHACTR
jgi:hypothetical protein